MRATSALAPLLAASLLTALGASPALARGGVWFGLGVGSGYPLYPAEPYPYYAPYPYPPAYAPAYPPPAYLPAPPVVTARPGQACYAGPVMCQLGEPGYVGQACSCPVRPGERAWGQVGE